MIHDSSPNSTEPTDTEAEIELAARRVEAEDLKIEARQDRVKDIEREAKIERLESVGDLVDKPKAQTVQRGPFAHGDYGTQDNTAANPAKIQPSWYTKSQATQRKELEKIMGTYRPVRGARKITLHDPGDPIRPGSLKDRHENPDVRRRNIKADSILGKATPFIPKRPASAPEPVMGYCRGCHKALPRYGIRADTKFCQDNNGKCSREFHNREKNREILNAAFKDYKPKVPETEDIRFFYPEPVPEPTPPMTASYAIQSNQVARYLSERRNGLVPG